MNIVMASFDTTVRQMTKMSQQKWLKCLSKKNSFSLLGNCIVSTILKP